MTEMIGHGRRASKDPNDHKFLIPRRREAARVVTQRTWYCKGVLDQGATDSCVGHAGSKYLTCGPVYNKFVDPFFLYDEARKNDEWPGENYDGTSTRGLFKALKKMGLVDEYQWAFEFEPVVNHVLTTGPVVMGTLWDDEMSNPDKHGYINPGPNIQGTEGGHEWLILGANRRKLNPDRSLGAIRLLNSWGLGWAQKGRAWLSFKNLDALIKLDGEACVAKEILAK